MKIYRARKSDELKRTETIAIRVSPTERETLFKQAEIEHDYPSNYLRKILLKHVEAVDDINGTVKMQEMQPELFSTNKKYFGNPKKSL